MTTSGISQENWNYLIVTLPIATFACPLGAFFAEHFHKHIIANLGMAVKIVALVYFLKSNSLNFERVS